MDLFLDQLPLAPLRAATVREMLAAGMLHFYAFTLVMTRLSGLMLIGPVLGQSLVPANVRVLLVLTLSLLVTPTLGQQWQRGLTQLDANGDRLIAREELPDHLLTRFDQIAGPPGTPSTELSIAAFPSALSLPATLLDYVWIAAGELALGFVLGLGVYIVMSAFQLAGELIDQQTGTSLGEVFNPGLDTTGSLSGQLFFLLATAAFLCLEPLSGHLLMVSALVETFQTLPVGEAFIATPTIELLRDLVHQSLVLGIQVAAPLLATMSLVALAMGFLGHTVPQINVLIVGFPIRILVSLLVLSLTLSGAARAVVDHVPFIITRLLSSLTGI